jgi:putative addiction module killer protein
LIFLPAIEQAQEPIPFIDHKNRTLANGARMRHPTFQNHPGVGRRPPKQSSRTSMHGHLTLTMVSFVLPLGMVEVREYLDRSGRSPYAAWFDHLNGEAAARVVAALARIQQGNFSNAKGVGAGVFEYRIDFGPGYRIYFGKDGDRLVVLVGGGTKKRQQEDIHTALARWQDYKERKGTGR